MFYPASWIPLHKIQLFKFFLFTLPHCIVGCFSCVQHIFVNVMGHPGVPKFCIYYNDLSWSFICVRLHDDAHTHCDRKYASCPAQTIREDIWFLRPITEQKCQHAWHHSSSLYAWNMPSTCLDDTHAHTCVPPKVPQLQEITGSSLALSVKREAPNPSTVTYGRGPGVKSPQRRRRTLYWFNIHWSARTQQCKCKRERFHICQCQFTWSKSGNQSQCCKLHNLNNLEVNDMDMFV